MTSGARAAAIVLLFLVLRLVLLALRDPFYDELFTVWLARQPFGAILPALGLDAGPPLYYYLARIPDVTALRLLSFLFASVPLALLLMRQQWVAAVLLAVHPAAALFAVDARAYALCGALVAVGVLAAEKGKVVPAALAFAGAAYAHYYGVLWIPALLFASAPWRRRIAAFAGACALFVPGLLLARAQPAEATRWMEGEIPWSALSIVPDSPDSLFARLPLAVLIAACIASLVALTRSFRFAPYVLVPIALAALISLVRPAYYPMRFESVLAVPLVLWMADSLARWPNAVRRALIALLLCLGIGAVAYAALDHARRPLDAYRAAALVLRESARPDDAIVATGYLYLEAVHALGDSRVLAFPREQALHPGWRASGVKGELPRGPFLWIAERDAPEGSAVAAGRRGTVLFANGRAVIVRFAGVETGVR